MVDVLTNMRDAFELAFGKQRGLDHFKNWSCSIDQGRVFSTFRECMQSTTTSRAFWGDSHQQFWNVFVSFDQTLLRLSSVLEPQSNA